MWNNFILNTTSQVEKWFFSVEKLWGGNWKEWKKGKYLVCYKSIWVVKSESEVGVTSSDKGKALLIGHTWLDLSPKAWLLKRLFVSILKQETHQCTALSFNVILANCRDGWLSSQKHNGQSWHWKWWRIVRGEICSKRFCGWQACARLLLHRHLLPPRPPHLLGLPHHGARPPRTRAFVSLSPSGKGGRTAQGMCVILSSLLLLIIMRSWRC